MITHFLKIAIRNIRKKGLLSFLNIAGLSIGIAAFLVITLYVFQETSYEKGYEKWESTYRIDEYFVSMGNVAWTAPNVQFVLGQIPEIEAHVRVAADFGMEVIKNEATILTDKTIWSDNAFFDVFDYEFVAGNSAAPLTGPGSAILTRSMAERIFGSIDIVGEELEIKKNGTFLVSAVVEDKMIKSHLDFDMLIHRQEEAVYQANKWYNIGGYTYAKVFDNVSKSTLDEKLIELGRTEIYPNAFLPVKGMSFEEWMEHDNHIELNATPISKIHLDSHLQFEMGNGGDKQTLITLAIIAAFILIIASINFMNLTTAKSSSRTKEIGMRKVLGSHRRGLIAQFLSESLLLTFIAAFIGAALTETIIVQLNQYYGAVIGISLTKYPVLLLNIGVGVLLLGVLAGLYPAFYLSSAKVIPLLKGMKLSRVLNMNIAKGLRNGLVVVQFTLSTGLIISSIFIYNQLLHLKNKDLGLDQEQVLVVTNANDLGSNKAAFKNELERVAGVESASFTQHVPGDNFNGIQSVMLDAENSVVFSTFNVDLDYQETLGLTMSDGKWFEEGFVKSDSLIIINQAGAMAIGLDDPVGKVFGNYYRIVAVVKDFNYGSYKEAIGPAIFRYTGDSGNRLVMRVDLNNIPMQGITRVWNKFSSENMSSHWLEQNFTLLLEKEEQTANAVLVFTVLAIIISCLGLFGLAAFTADQRIHEFGIRKVLGATVGDIVKIFSFDFMKLIGVAFLISVPLAIWGVNVWLQGFADRISLSAGVFVLAGFLAIFIAFGTIFFQSLKTGKLNPVDTIGNE